MSECPVCHQQIEIPEQNRGTLFACPRCNGVYFVSWDGVPEAPPSEEEMAAPPEPTAFENPPEISVESPIEQEWSIPEPVVPVEEGFPAAQEFAPVPEFNPEPSVPSTEIAASEFPDESQGYNFDQPLGENPDFSPPVAEMNSIADEPTFADVTDFGNSDTAAGPLSFTVIIEGIDTGKIYGELKEALNDSRFRWNVPELLKTIHEGRMEIGNLNPAKAFMLVNRIKYLSLKITWRQDVLSGS